jgi:hypothetical protein
MDRNILTGNSRRKVNRGIPLILVWGDDHRSGDHPRASDHLYGHGPDDASEASVLAATSGVRRHQGAGHGDPPGSHLMGHERQSSDRHGVRLRGRVMAPIPRRGRGYPAWPASKAQSLLVGARGAWELIESTTPIGFDGHDLSFANDGSRPELYAWDPSGSRGTCSGLHFMFRFWSRYEVDFIH